MLAEQIFDFSFFGFRKLTHFIRPESKIWPAYYNLDMVCEMLIIPSSLKFILKTRPI